MLVDNAIVVVEGMKIKIEAGEDRIEAAKSVVGQTATPLLGATVVAVMAFAAIGTSQDSTGEFCRSLFQVILISLMLSWLTAVTTTPLFCKMFLKGKPEGKDKGESKDPYGGGIFRLYKNFLTACLKVRWLTIAVVVGLFCISLYGFRFVDNSFFPNSTRPQFFIDFWMPEGTDIRDTEKTLAKAEKYLLGLEGVTNVATAVGGGEVRFLLTYTPETTSTSYGQIIVSVDSFNKIQELGLISQRELTELLPDTIVNTREFRLGPGDGGKIQIRISGPDHDTVRELADRAKDIMIEDGGLKGIRTDWREKVKVIRPQLLEAQARRLGITRPDVAY